MNEFIETVSGCYVCALLVCQHITLLYGNCVTASRNLKVNQLINEDTKGVIEEEQTTQWPKEKAQKDKQRSTKRTYKSKDRVTRTPLKTGSELRCSGRVSSSCSTSGTRCVKYVKYVTFSTVF
jgi:hypothetical protein